MANKIVIDFQLGKGSTKVKQAIESLATAQSKLNNTVKAALDGFIDGLKSD